MRIRRRPAVIAPAPSTNRRGKVCSWCGQAIDRDNEGLSPVTDVSRKAMKDNAALPVTRSSCANTAENESHQSSSGDGLQLIEIIRVVFDQTSNASLTPKQACARMLVSGLCDGQEPNQLLERVVSTMTTDPSFVRLKRGRFRMRSSDTAAADEMDEGTSDRKQVEETETPKVIRLDVEPDVIEDQDLCSCKNGNGWRCSRKVKEGYHLCQHHLDLKLKRKMDKLSRTENEKMIKRNAR